MAWPWSGPLWAALCYLGGPRVTRELYFLITASNQHSTINVMGQRDVFWKEKETKVPSD